MTKRSMNYAGRSPLAIAPPDHDAARELELYLENDRQLYDQSQYIQRNLMRKLKRGKYDPEKAPQAFSYVAEAAAKKYAKEFGGTWNTIFSPSTRKYVAFELAKEFEAQASRGELDYLLTK